MNPEHLAGLCSDFAIGTPLTIEENHEGVLNRNYFLTTDTGKYFIKLIREKRRAEIPYIAGVEELMRERGIPALCMLSTNDGQKSVSYGDEMFTLYSFIESVTCQELRSEDYRRMGEMLGRIHRAGSERIPEMLRAPARKKKNKDEIHARLLHFRAHILELENRTALDDEFLCYIELKLEAWETFADQSWLPADTLVHGDYHARNLLMNSGRDIIGVCDWEDSQYVPTACPEVG